MAVETGDLVHDPLPLRAGIGAQIKAVRPRSDYRQVSRRGFPDLGSGQTPRRRKTQGNADQETP